MRAPCPIEADLQSRRGALSKYADVTPGRFCVVNGFEVFSKKRDNQGEPVHEILNRNEFFVKEHVGLFKAANEYDILDPETGKIIMQCREPNLGWITKIARFTDYKRMTPFDVVITDSLDKPIIKVQRGISLFLSNVSVLDENDKRIGGFKQKLFSIGGAFTVINERDEPVCTLKGKWTGWDFKFLAPDNTELAHVTKEWAGLGKELFTSADNYVLKISDAVPKDAPLRQLILGAVMCIDMVLKE